MWTIGDSRLLSMCRLPDHLHSKKANLKTYRINARCFPMRLEVMANRPKGGLIIFITETSNAKLVGGKLTLQKYNQLPREYTDILYIWQKIQWTSIGRAVKYQGSRPYICETSPGKYKLLRIIPRLAFRVNPHFLKECLLVWYNAISLLKVGCLFV